MAKLKGNNSISLSIPREELSSSSGLTMKKTIHGIQKCQKYSKHGENVSGNFTLLGTDEFIPPSRFFFHVSSLHQCSHLKLNTHPLKCCSLPLVQQLLLFLVDPICILGSRSLSMFRIKVLYIGKFCGKFLSNLIKCV